MPSTGDFNNSPLPPNHAENTGLSSPVTESNVQAFAERVNVDLDSLNESANVVITVFENSLL